MRTLDIFVELNGEQTLVGTICGDSVADAVFSYDEAYRTRIGCPISISLPLDQEPFSAEATRNFFEGLLPEGFTRSSVATWMHVDVSDYLSILAGLGQECLGALQILEHGMQPAEDHYELLSTEQVRALAREGATVSAELVTEAHLSLTGASGKVGLYYAEDTGSWYLPRGEAPSTHIVKQSHIRLDQIVANEQLCMMTAARMGLTVPDSFIIPLGDRTAEGDVLYATRRFDRQMEGAARRTDGLLCPRRLHQEDFAQAMGVSASEKYEKGEKGYLKRMHELIRQYSADPIADQLKLWEMLIFDYLIGNTDNHIKNHSFLYQENLKTIRLAPAYDIVSTTVYEASTRNMAFQVGGAADIRKIDRECFRRAAAECRTGEKPVLRIFDSMTEGFENALEESASQLTEEGFGKARNLQERILKTGGYAFLK